MKKLSSIIVAACALAVSLQAQNFTTPVQPRWYVKADAGAQHIEDIGVKQGLGVPLTNATGSFNPGPRLGLTIGCQLDGGWALELETGAAFNTVNDFTVDGLSYASAGSAEVWTVPLLFNVVWAADSARGLVLRPFIGAGVGGHYANGELNIPGLGFSDSGDSFVFAWQAKAGLAFRLTDRMDLTLTYRFLQAFNHKIKQTEFEDACIHALSVGIEGRF